LGLKEVGQEGIKLAGKQNMKQLSALMQILRIATA
jgi:hypothetical protein